jgi:iron complex transport system substrate-binding protein
MDTVRHGADPGDQKSCAEASNAMEKGFSVAVLALLLVLLGCGREPGKNANKIVTLTPSATEIVAALGAVDRLVGIDDFSSYPQEVNRLPRVGSFLQPSFERIVRLQPDLVIADDIHADASAALRGAGIDVLLAPMHSIPHLREAYRRIGARIGRADAARVATEALDAVLEAARARRRGQGLRVLIVIDHEVGGLGGMIAAANGSWLDELVALTGAQNVLAGAAARYPKVSPEEILRARPDVIIDVTYSADAASAPALWRALGDVPAVANGRVHVLEDAYLMGPSPRVAEAIAALEAVLVR